MSTMLVVFAPMLNVAPALLLVAIMARDEILERAFVQGDRPSPRRRPEM